jgi:hypothetical protein
MINWKGFRRKRLGPNRVTISAWEGMRTFTNDISMLAVVPTMIRTERLQNTSLDQPDQKLIYSKIPNVSNSNNPGNMATFILRH